MTINSRKIVGFSSSNSKNAPKYSLCVSVQENSGCCRCTYVRDRMRCSVNRVGEPYVSGRKWWCRYSTARRRNTQHNIKGRYMSYITGRGWWDVLYYREWLAGLILFYRRDRMNMSYIIGSGWLDISYIMSGWWDISYIIGRDRKNMSFIIGIGWSCPSPILWGGARWTCHIL